MTKAIFTTSESSAYDDQPELRYHFPKTYLRRAKEAEGDWIIYYEPRRTTGPSSATGRQAYFAMARVHRVEADPRMRDHYYAFVNNFLEFDRPVPFREGAAYFESGLMKADGSANKGAFGRSVRPIPEDEFAMIVRAGFATDVELWERPVGVEEESSEYEVRPILQQIVSRRFRDRAFTRHVRDAYRNTCAISGLGFVNGGGRPEVQAAHIRPVEADGPDTVRNGLALTGTVHWLFDRGLISIDDQFKVLLSPSGLPKNVLGLVTRNRQIALPERQEQRPHPTYLKWHRDHRFKA